MMNGLYLLPPDSWSAERTEGKRRASVNVHFSPSFGFVCTCSTCVCACPSWLLSRLFLLTAVFPMEDSEPHSPFPSAQAPPFHPSASSLTGRVVKVMDDCALGFSVRVLLLCYPAVWVPVKDILSGQLYSPSLHRLSFLSSFLNTPLSLHYSSC